MALPLSAPALHIRTALRLVPGCRATLMPFLLEGVGGIPALNFPNGIHPNPAGHKIMAKNGWQVLEPRLQALQAS